MTKDGLSKANKQLVDNAPLYRMNDKENFFMGYLSGLLAENRGTEKKQFVLDVQIEVRQSTL